MTKSLSGKVIVMSEFRQRKAMARPAEQAPEVEMQRQAALELLAALDEMDAAERAVR